MMTYRMNLMSAGYISLNSTLFKIVILQKNLAVRRSPGEGRGKHVRIVLIVCIFSIRVTNLSCTRWADVKWVSVNDIGQE
jgi:hypothetical protein